MCIRDRYRSGDLVTVERPGIMPKLSFPRHGPYKILQVHDNGTVTIQKEPFVTDQVNIRRVQPFHPKMGNKQP